MCPFGKLSSGAVDVFVNGPRYLHLYGTVVRKVLSSTLKNYSLVLSARDKFEIEIIKYFRTYVAQ